MSVLHRRREGWALRADEETGQRGWELPRVLVITLVLAGSVIVLAGMRASAGILGPIFLALIVTIAVHPLQRLLTRLMPRWAAAALCLLVVYVVLAGLVLALIASGARLASLLPRYEEQFAAGVANVTDRLMQVGVSRGQMDSLAERLDLSRLTALVSDALSGVVGVLSSLVLIVTILFFTVIDAGTFPRRLQAAAEAGFHPGVVSALMEFARSTVRYLVVSTVFGLIVAVLDTGVLLLMGIPAPALWGLLAFLTNYIPNVGFVIGLVPPAVLGLLEGGPKLMLGVIAAYCVLNLVIQSFIQPKVVGDAVGFSATLSFLSLVFWAWVLGPVGAILAIPMSLLVRALLLDADPDAQWLRPLVANADPDEEEEGDETSAPQTVRHRAAAPDVP